jgi:hypothetical protein
MPLTFSCQRTITLVGKTREVSEGVEYDIYFMEYDFCPVWSHVLIATPPLSNQINLLMVINIWGIIIYFTFLFTQFVFVSKTVKYQKMKPLNLLWSLLFLSSSPCMVYFGSLFSPLRMCLLEFKLQWWYLDFHFFYDFSDWFSIKY